MLEILFKSSLEALRKSSSGALLKSSPRALSAISTIGLVVAQATIGIVRSTYLASQTTQMSPPMNKILYPTSTTPLLASKTTYAVGNTEPIKLSMLLSGLIFLGVLISGTALLTMMRGGDSGRNSETRSPIQGSPPRQVDHPSDRAPSDPSAHPPRAFSRTDEVPPVYSLSSSGAPPPPPPPEYGAGPAAFLGDIESLLWLVLLLIVVILALSIGLVWYITTSSTSFHFIIGLLAILSVVAVELCVSWVLNPLWYTIKLIIRTSKRLVSKIMTLQQDPNAVVLKAIVVVFALFFAITTSAFFATIELDHIPQAYKALESVINWGVEWFYYYSHLFLSVFRLPIIRNIVGDIIERFYDRFNSFYIIVSLYTVAVVDNYADIFH